MKQISFWITIVILFFITSCKTQKMAIGIRLTDENVAQYIRAYTSLRKKAPHILEAINNDPNNSRTAINQYQSIEGTIKESGLKDYPMFVLLNAKIGSVFSLLQAEKGMDRFANLNSSSNVMLDDGIAEIERLLNDPVVPEDSKADLRQTLAELKAGKNELNTEYSHNKKIADWVIDKTTKITGLIVNKNEIEVVKRNEKAIMKAYVGFPLPYEFDGTMERVDFHFDTSDFSE